MTSRWGNPYLRFMYIKFCTCLHNSASCVGHVTLPYPTLQRDRSISFHKELASFHIHGVDIFLFLHTVDFEVTVGHGQVHEGRLKSHVPDECKDEPAAATEDNDGV